MIKPIGGEIESQELNDNFSAVSSLANETITGVNNIYSELNKNLFDGKYVDGVLFSSPIDGEYHLIPVNNFSSYQGKVAIIPIEHGKTYTIKCHDPDKQTMFRYGTSSEYPQFVEKGDDLQVGEPIPDGYYPLDGYRYVHNSNNVTEATHTNDRNMNWLSVYINNQGEEPRLQIEEGNEATSYVPRINIQRTPSKPIHVQDEEAKEAFVAEMNKYAERIGMVNSNFVEPAGYPTNEEQQMSTKDMLLLTIQAAGYKEIARVWNKPSYDFVVGGPNYRERTINSTIKTENLGDYFVYGGKTGSIVSIPELAGRHLIVVTDAPNDNMFVAALRQADTDEQRYQDMLTALDNATSLIDDPNAQTTDIDSESVAITLMPKFNPFNYEQYDVPIIYGKNTDLSGHPASLTKIMTAIITLDYVKDLKKKITIKSSDVKSGSGNYFDTGDIMTVEDALYCLFLPSSNTVAHALSRVVGNIILVNEEGMY